MRHSLTVGCPVGTATGDEQRVGKTPLMSPREALPSLMTYGRGEANPTSMSPSLRSLARNGALRYAATERTPIAERGSGCASRRRCRAFGEYFQPTRRHWSTQAPLPMRSDICAMSCLPHQPLRAHQRRCSTSVPFARLEFTFENRWCMDSIEHPLDWWAYGGYPAIMSELRCTKTVARHKVLQKIEEYYQHTADPLWRPIGNRGYTLLRRTIMAGLVLDDDLLETPQLGSATATISLDSGLTIAIPIFWKIPTNAPMPAQIVASIDGVLRPRPQSPHAARTRSWAIIMYAFESPTSSRTTRCVTPSNSSTA